MTLPKTFKCNCGSDREVYTVTVVNDKVMIDWDDNDGEPVTFGLGYVRHQVSSGAWSIIEEIDNVNHPSHYQGKTEVIDIIEQATTDLNGFQAYCLGNVIKYVMRHQKKGGIEDLKKARWYLNRVIGGESE